MVDSLRPVQLPKDFQNYTQFMQSCTIDAMKGFNRDGSKVTFDEAFTKCRESWIKAKGQVNKTPTKEEFEDLTFLFETEDGVLFITEDLTEFFEKEGL